MADDIRTADVKYYGGFSSFLFRGLYAGIGKEVQLFTGIEIQRHGQQSRFID